MVEFLVIAPGQKLAVPFARRPVARYTSLRSAGEQGQSPHAEAHDRLYGVGKAVAPNWLRQNRGSWYHFMDALDSVAVSVSSNEDDRYVAFLSKRFPKPIALSQ